MSVYVLFDESNEIITCSLSEETIINKMNEYIKTFSKQYTRLGCIVEHETWSTSTKIMVHNDDGPCRRTSTFYVKYHKSKLI